MIAKSEVPDERVMKEALQDIKEMSKKAIIDIQANQHNVNQVRGMISHTRAGQSGTSKPRLPRNHIRSQSGGVASSKHSSRSCRSFDSSRFQSYLQSKNEKLAALRKEQEELARQEETFKPVLSKKSAQLTARHKKGNLSKYLSINNPKRIEGDNKKKEQRLSRMQTEKEAKEALEV